MKILIIRRDNIGDLICTTPLIQALRQHDPDAQIDVLGNSYNVCVLQNNPDVNTVFAYQKLKHRRADQGLWRFISERVRLIYTLRKQHYDYAIMAGSSASKHALRLARQSRAKHLIGYYNDELKWMRAGDSGFATPAFDEHEVLAVHRLASPLGVNGEPPPMRLFADPREQQSARTIVQTHAAQRADKPLIGVHISARMKINQWPAAHFIEWIKRIDARYQARFMLLWTPGVGDDPLYPGDDLKAEQIIAALDKVPIIVQRTDGIAQLIGAEAVCDYIIGCDSGALHIGAALGKQILGLYTDIKIAHWRPWAVRHEALSAKRVEDITVDDAVAAFERLSRTHPS